MSDFGKPRSMGCRNLTSTDGDEDMTIYFDGIHLVSDSSIQELHEFAERVGLKRHWFQNKRRRFRPHYDVKGLNLRLRAFNLGAIYVSQREVISALRRWQQKI